MKTLNLSFCVWPPHRLQDENASAFQPLAQALGKLGVDCLVNCRHVDGEHPILFLVNENTSEEEEQDCFKLAADHMQAVYVIYLGEKRLPFHHTWRLLGMGAGDVLSAHEPATAECLQARLQRRAYLDKILDTDLIKHKLIGHSNVWQSTLRDIIEVACFSQAPVLILGESGTGKEQVARLIHELDKRPNKEDLILLDCTTIVPELSGSEFFGHEKGSFTSAVSTRDGAFSLADHGTLFLDEVGELPLRLQAELLRVSQEGLFKRVGSNQWQKTSFRLICATNRNLKNEVEKGNFREDLFYRLSTCIIRLPPLRERKSDIPELAQSFLAEALNTDSPPLFDPQVRNFLITQNYPGNVRQLKQMVSRLAYRHSGKGPITMGDLPISDREQYAFSAQDWQGQGLKEAILQAIEDGVGLKEIKRIAGDVALNLAIEVAAGNLQEAARRLDVSDRLVQGWLAEKRG
jgi:transcriptional regulator with GAF, ATPase, and Fis domain